MTKIDKYLRSRDFESVEQMRIHERFTKEIEANLRRKKREYNESIINFMERLTEIVLSKLRNHQEEEAFKFLNKKLHFLLNELFDNFNSHDDYIASSLDCIEKLSRKYSNKENNIIIRKMYIERVKKFVTEQKRELKITPSFFRRMKKSLLFDLSKVDSNSKEAEDIRKAIKVLDDLAEQTRIKLEYEESLEKESSLTNKDIIELAAVRRNLSGNLYKNKFSENKSNHITRTFYITC